MDVGLAPELDRRGAARHPAEHLEVGRGPAGALPRHGLAQDGVGREQIYIDEGRTLIERRVVPGRIGHMDQPARGPLRRAYPNSMATLDCLVLAGLYSAL